MIRSTAVLMALLAASITFADEGCEPQRLISPPDVPATHFGNSVATNGRFWFVGDSQARVGCCTTGAVHVYENVGGELVYTQTLVPHDAASFDQFGTSVDADGDRLVVGSYNTAWPTTPGRGGGFVFEFNGEAWIETSRLIPPPSSGGVGGGIFVSLLGDRAVLAPATTYSDEIYVYEFFATDWQLRQTIDRPIDLPLEAVFGGTVAMDGQWLFASAHLDPTYIRDGGSVYAFRRGPEGVFEFAQKFLPPEPYIDNREFGFWLALDGHTLAIAARRVEREFEWQGAIFIYELEGDQWVLKQELTHNDPQQGDELGHRMALTGDLLLARTNRNGRDPGHEGSVLRFERDTHGQWREVGELVPNPPSFAGFYGLPIATDGRHAIAGAKEDHAGGTSYPGAAYFFDLDCTTCPPDLDADGSLTVFDFLTFLNLFQDGDVLADFDGDGELTIFDFLAFQTAFDAGCD